MLSVIMLMDPPYFDVYFCMQKRRWGGLVPHDKMAHRYKMLRDRMLQSECRISVKTTYNAACVRCCVVLECSIVLRCRFVGATFFGGSRDPHI
jgi:hypothetical protein